MHLEGKLACIKGHLVLSCTGVGGYTYCWTKGH